MLNLAHIGETPCNKDNTEGSRELKFPDPVTTDPFKGEIYIKYVSYASSRSYDWDEGIVYSQLL